jgi:hypothetical protein
MRHGFQTEHGVRTPDRPPKPLLTGAYDQLDRIEAVQLDQRWCRPEIPRRTDTRRFDSV